MAAGATNVKTNGQSVMCRVHFSAKLKTAYLYKTWGKAFWRLEWN